MFLLKFYLIQLLFLFVYSNGVGVGDVQNNIIVGQHEDTLGNTSGVKGSSHSKVTVDFECSRWHSYKAEIKGRKPLLSFLTEIRHMNIIGKQWELINKIFSSLPQWRREKTALLYCKKMFKIQNDLSECLKKLFESYNMADTGHIERSKLLELLIMNKTEVLAERLFITLTSIEMTEKTDYENLYELILACPKFELQHIIKKYDKFFDSVKYLKNFKFESKAKNFSKLSKHLLYIKELKNEKVDEKIWQILINRLESVYKKEFYDEDEVNKIYAQINSLCDNANEDNGAEIFMPFFEVLLTMFEFKSEVEEELRVKFERCIKDYFEFPPYMKKMLDITGLAGEENYINDITTRIKGFIEEPNYEALLTLVVIHHGSDFFKILKDFENTIESEQIKNDVFGLGSFFSYSKTEYFITCYKETEKEYLSELKLGALEYENEAKVKTNHFPEKSTFCLKLKIFQENFEEIYDQNLIKERNDFETLGEWKNSIQKRIDLLWHTNNPQSLPYLPIKGPECSRWYPNAFDHIRGKTPVWLILYEVLNGKIFSKTGRWEHRWELIIKLFLPLPQWRREETALLYCEISLKLEDHSLDKCLKKLFEDVKEDGINSKLLELLIKDKCEALALRLFQTLIDNDFDNLYDIILARPKFELEKIIKFYNSEKSEKLEDRLEIKKNQSSDNKILWEILIDRVNNVRTIQPFEDIDFKELSKQILSFCENINTVPNEDEIEKLIKYIGRMLSNLEFKSEKAKNFGLDLTKKCVGKLQNSSIKKEKNSRIQILLENMQRMLIITGLAGKIKYDNNTVNRIKHYNENSNFEGLLSFVVIHHGIDMLSITKKLDNEIKKEKVNKEQLENHLVDLNFRFKNLVKEENINVEEKMELENKLEEIGLIKEFKTELNSKNSVLNDELKDTIINLKFIEIINKYGTEKLKLHKEIKQLELKIDKSSIESKNFQIKEEEFSILEEKIKIVNTLKNSFNMEANKKLEDRTNEFKKLEKELKNENLNIKNQQKALLKVFIQEIEMLKNNYKKELNKDKKEKLKKEYVKEYNEKIQEFLADFKSLQKSGETNKKENQNKLKNILTNKFIFEMKIKLKELKNSFDNDTKTKEKLKGKINDIKNEEDEFKKLKDNLKKEIHNIKEQQKEKLNLFIQDKNNLENKYKNDLSKIKKEEYDLKKILEGTISVGKKKLEENLIQIKIKKEELKNKLNEKVGAKEKIYKIQWNYLKNNEDDIEKIIASKKIFFELKNKLIEELEEIKKGEFMKNKIEENELNIIEETTLKRKLDDKEINIKSIKENKNKLSVEKSQIEKKLQIFGIIDDDRHGLKSFFTYTKLNDTSCSKDTEKEYEMDVKLGNLEYEYNVIFKNKDMLIHLIEWEVFCKEIQNFRELMDNIYSKNAIKERNDFEIVDEWIYGRSQNSIEKRIVKLKDVCLDFQKTKVIDRFFIEYKNGKTCDPEHAQALISDKNEAIAERLYYILNSAENTDDYALYAIFLARPKNELNDIVEKYDKIAHNMEKEKTLFEKLKLSNNIVSDFKNPKLIKHLEEHMAKEKLYKEIWHIFINRVHPNHLEDSKKISEKSQVCDEKINVECKENLEEMLSNFDFNSDNLKESGKHLAEKYGQTIQSNKIPDYMKIMLLITGLAGKEKFKDSIGERIKFYLANNLVEELLSLLIVHKASDLIDIIEKLIKNNDFSEDYKWFKEMFEEKFKQIGIELVSNPPAGTSATGRTTLIDLMARSGRLKPGGILIEECESEDPQEGSTKIESGSADKSKKKVTFLLPDGTTVDPQEDEQSE